jgi:hypothetical protein
MEDIHRISAIEFDPECPRTADLPIRKKARKLKPAEIDAGSDTFYVLTDPSSEESDGEAHLDVEA